ncbi:beta-ketoacyl synthase [Parapedobacter sp. 2B3]|uniref:beta-ketoacyl-[acyl-carrier-protein] synthase family protein n=1 Tax=Parapedobacter sp. 2B3 TaxID=3342381 RepID=UPI0035B5F75D
MRDQVYIIGDEVISPLGAGSELNFQRLRDGHTAIAPVVDANLCDHPIYAAQMDDAPWHHLVKDARHYTRLERLSILVLQRLIDKHDIPLDNETLVILSTTKGNISLLGNPESAFPQQRANLTAMAEAIRRYFGFENPLLTLSNACISGALAISVARRLLRYNSRYKRAIVAGGDELSRFVVSGFDAFQALADGPCRPFDRDRKGLNLGEAVVAVYLSTTPTQDAVEILGVGSSNDANHISGPSRTGEGLYLSIQEATHEAGNITPDFISAHGTATPYNDEMESIAFQRCGLSAVPTHSLKGYFGHTLGASGLLETVMAIHSLKNNELIPSHGFAHPGTSQPLNIITQRAAQPLSTFLKTASGFGGCNIAMMIQKV